ncbi:MAG TPA: hypothetical protein VLE48_15260 [Terriglobales bacterium]|nr:hypothetical protein [Terriglobales bacterium]
MTLVSMNDQEFMAAFESGQLSGKDFHHADHVHMAWLYLRTRPVLEAIADFSAALRRLAAANGKPNLYHETITWAYLFLVRERMERGAECEGWNEFARANPDLLDWTSPILKRFYREETLKSDLARRVFLLPDRPAQTEESPGDPELEFTAETADTKSATDLHN